MGGESLKSGRVDMFASNMLMYVPLTYLSNGRVPILVKE